MYLKQAGIFMLFNKLQSKAILNKAMLNNVEALLFWLRLWFSRKKAKHIFLFCSPRKKAKAFYPPALQYLSPTKKQSICPPKERSIFSSVPLLWLQIFFLFSTFFWALLCKDKNFLFFLPILFLLLAKKEQFFRFFIFNPSFVRKHRFLFFFFTRYFFKLSTIIFIMFLKQGYNSGKFGKKK